MCLLSVRQMGGIHTSVRQMPTMPTNQILQQGVPEECLGIPSTLVCSSKLVSRTHFSFLNTTSSLGALFIYAAYCMALGSYFIPYLMKRHERIPQHTQTAWFSGRNLYRSWLGVKVLNRHERKETPIRLSFYTILLGTYCYWFGSRVTSRTHSLSAMQLLESFYHFCLLQRGVSPCLVLSLF